MSDDLIKRVCQSWVDAGLGDETFWENWPNCPTDDTLSAKQVLDRIEQLERERDEERSKRKMAEGLAGLSSIDIDGHSAMITLARDQVGKRMKAEAKLAKAMAGLRKIADHKHFSWDQGWTQNAEARIASTVLAELEGGE